MKKVDFEHFSRFLMPHSVKMNGDDVYFCVKKADMKANNYTHDLYRMRGGDIRKMTALGDVGSYLLSPEGILFAAARTKEEKEKAESGIPNTVFYLLPYDGGEAIPYLTLPYAVDELVPAGKNRYFFTATESLLYLEKLEENDGNAEKAAETMKEEADYHTVDEIPFYLNGAGYTNRLRSHLFLYENGEIKPLSKKAEDCQICSSNFGRLLLTVSDFPDGKAGFSNQLVKMDMTSLHWEDVSVRKDCCHYAAWSLPDGKTVVIANAADRLGMNQNPDLYLLENGAYREVLAGGPLSYESSVNSDILASGKTNGMDLPVKNGFFWSLDTVWNHTAVTGVNLLTGDIVRVNDNEMNITSFDFCGDGFILTALEGNGGTELYWMDMDGRTEKLSGFNDTLKEEYEYSAPVRFTFFDEEGTEIEGWVMEPSDYVKGKKYPAILDVHGGPKTVYGSCYFHEMQLFASMGYFVFFCNPVGSDGRGDDFSDIFGHYGDRDFRDIMAFTDRVLRKYPDIDPERVGVTGGSYGGFMTNWIIGHTDRFRAAASQRSISNWISFHNTSDIGYFFTPDQTHGTPWTDLQKIWDQSPLKYADRVHTPTLFIHSDEDYRCPLSEGMQMFTALRDHGVDARMCIFKGETHELSRSGKPKHRVRRLTEITNWFEKYLK